jgi:leucyl/phenylalanyl-tRNA--protein transferase
MAHAYSQLHHLGYAHSLEVWLGDTLVGGLYGISLGKLFFGESMFSTVSDASKAAFVALARQCQAWDFPLIDCQIANPHLSSMGAIDISRQAFLDILDNHAELPHPLGPWQFSIDTGALV